MEGGAIRRGVLLALAVFAITLAGAIAAHAAADTVTLPVPVATIYPGDAIDGGMLEERTFARARAGEGIVDSGAALVGMVARRTLLPGHPIPANAVDRVDIVTRGNPVQLVFRQAGLVITTYASPLQDGSAGDVIRLRNDDSGAIVMGVVEPDGTVSVGPR
jgi:flagella basal body P-ring formation protein FlgA